MSSSPLKRMWAAYAFVILLAQLGAEPDPHFLYRFEYAGQKSKATPAKPAALLPQTILLLKLDEGEGLPQDHSEQKHPVKSMSASWTDKGRFGAALEFDGKGSLNLGDALSFEGTDAFSISAWVKTTEPSGQIVSKMRTRPHKGYDFGMEQGRLGARILHEWVANGIGGYGSTPVNDGQWHFVMMTYDGSSNHSGLRLYVDGLPEEMRNWANGLTGTIQNEMPLTIGTGDRAFQGSIDDVRIVQRALTPEEIGPEADPTLFYSDLLRLESGDTRQGKILEWGTQVYFWDLSTGQRETFSRGEIAREGLNIYGRRGKRAKPDLPDLTVAFIERVPRDPGFHGVVQYEQPGKEGLPVLSVDSEKYSLHLSPGQKVTFIVNVLNAGSRPAPPFDYEIILDEDLLLRGQTAGPIVPGAIEKVSVPWLWKEGQHLIRVRLDTGNKLEEIAEWNNEFIDPVRALTYFFLVPRSTWEANFNTRNMVDTFNFADWAQYHVHTMNWLFEHSVYLLSAPEGIHERVRIDNMVVVDDELATSHGGLQSEALKPLHRIKGDPDVSEYNGYWVMGRTLDPEKPAHNAPTVEWSLPHELGHQLGLVDIYQLNTGMEQCLVRGAEGYLNLMHFFPQPATMMHWHGPHLFSEQCAGYLNTTRDRPRGFFGDYYYAIPRENFLRVLANNGEPLKGVRIEVYQRNWDRKGSKTGAGPGPLASHIGPQVIGAGETDERGRWQLPDQPAPEHQAWATPFKLRPNPWGFIDVVGRNCLLLARLSLDGQSHHEWLRLFDFNVAWFRGHKESFDYEVRTRFAPANAPRPPHDLLLDWYQPEGQRWSKLRLKWMPSPTPSVTEYRVHRRLSFGDDGVKPFVLLSSVPATDRRPDGSFMSEEVPFWEDPGEFRFYSRDSFFAVTAVDEKGLESQLSNIAVVPHLNSAKKLAVGPDGRVLLAVQPSSRDSYPSLYHWTPQRGFQPFGIRAALFKEGYPPNAEAIAFDRAGNLIVTDPWKHQVAWYDAKGDLFRLVGREDFQAGKAAGEFNRPSDVAVDAAGKVYVADTGNQRVQILDSEGRFAAMLDEAPDLQDFAGGKNNAGMKEESPRSLEEPAALGISGKWLCVTDTKARRLFIYNIAGKVPVRSKEIDISDVEHPDRALVSPGGRIYLTGDKARKPGVVVYSALEGKFEQMIEEVDGRRIGPYPRGLCPAASDTAYFVAHLPVGDRALFLQDPFRIPLK